MFNIKKIINSKEALLVSVLLASISSILYEMLEIKSLMGLSAIMMIYMLFKFMFDDSIELYSNKNIL